MEEEKNGEFLTWFGKTSGDSRRLSVYAAEVVLKIWTKADDRD